VIAWFGPIMVAVALNLFPFLKVTYRKPIPEPGKAVFVPPYLSLVSAPLFKSVDYPSLGTVAL